MIELSKEARIVHDAIALQKGDAEGHEFHSNQYSGGGGTHGKTLSSKEMRSARVESSKEGHTVMTDAGRHMTYESKGDAQHEADRLRQIGGVKAGGESGKEVSIGDKVTVRPEWRDAGDEAYHFTAITEPNATGHFKAQVESKAKDSSSIRSVMELHTSHIEEKFRAPKADASGGRESKAFDRQGKEAKVYIPGKGK